MSLFFLLLLSAAGGALKLYRHPLAYMRLYNVYTPLISPWLHHGVYSVYTAFTAWISPPGDLEVSREGHVASHGEIQSLSSSYWPIVH